MSAKTEGNAAYLRRLRQEAVARGDCYDCRCRPVKPGCRYCTDCMTRTKTTKAKWAGRKCLNCGVAVRRRQRCRSCTAKDTARSKKRADTAAAGGICFRCKKRPLQPGRKQCTGCLDALAARVLARRRAEGAAPTAKCRTCKALGIESTGHDHRSHDRWMAKQRTER